MIWQVTTVFLLQRAALWAAGLLKQLCCMRGAFRTHWLKNDLLEIVKRFWNFLQICRVAPDMSAVKRLDTYFFR